MVLTLMKAMKCGGLSSGIGKVTMLLKNQHWI